VHGFIQPQLADDQLHDLNHNAVRLSGSLAGKGWQIIFTGNGERACVCRRQGRAQHDQRDGQGRENKFHLFTVVVALRAASEIGLSFFALQHAWRWLIMSALTSLADIAP
jgi:hypothetical protein